jgi:hypothetical protein
MNKSEAKEALQRLIVDLKNGQEDGADFNDCSNNLWINSLRYNYIEALETVSYA